MKKSELASAAPQQPPPPPPPIPVICDRCRAEGSAGDDPFAAIADLLTFEPVARRAHVNNWTAEHQRAFVAGLAITGSPRQAARALGRHAFGAEQLRTAKGGRSFADACDAALELYRERELYRIRGNLAGLAEQQQNRDRSAQGVRGTAEHSDGSLAQAHLRALPPPSSSPAFAGDGDHTGPRYDSWGVDLVEERQAALEFDESTARVRRKLFMCRRLYLKTIAADPERRAAWELLCGPADWDAAAALGEQPDERRSRETDLSLLQHATWQVPLKTGFAPALTDPAHDPGGNALSQLEESVRRNDPRFSASTDPGPDPGDVDPEGSPE